MTTPNGPENHAVFPEDFGEAPTPPEPTMAEVMAAIKALATTIPTPDQVRQAAQAAAEQAAQRLIDDQQRKAEAEQVRALQDFQRQAAEVKTLQSNGNGAHPEQQLVPVAGNDKVGTAINIGGAILKMLNDNLVPMTETWLNLQMKREQIKIFQNSPIAQAQAWYAMNPQQAQYIGMFLAPDNLRNMYPAMVASAVDATTQGIKTGYLRSGWTPPGGIPIANGKGGWILLPDGRQVFDPNMPSPPPGGGSLAPNPFGTPLISPDQVPGFGKPQPNPQPNVMPSSPVPTPSGGVNTSTKPSEPLLTPAPSSSEPLANPPSPVPGQPAVKMGQGSNILMALKW